ncbi:hypothetical protein [Marinoscillum sp. MHG1-6]|uniref:hypothetical protein n=1 Tax=Marinoscillum sp. MHG1-6 TaxID=2959627 RepID=UPI00215732AE|nr:hypothetical protein [Marinoscillum sp. MHG1-6]
MKKTIILSFVIAFASITVTKAQWSLTTSFGVTQSWSMPYEVYQTVHHDYYGYEVVHTSRIPTTGVGYFEVVLQRGNVFVQVNIDRYGHVHRRVVHSYNPIVNHSCTAHCGFHTDYYRSHHNHFNRNVYVYSGHNHGHSHHGHHKYDKHNHGDNGYRNGNKHNYQGRGNGNRHDHYEGRGNGNAYGHSKGNNGNAYGKGRNGNNGQGNGRGNGNGNARPSNSRSSSGRSMVAYDNSGSRGSSASSYPSRRR